MKVLNLLCANEHRFEGWFASDDDYRSQDERGLLACPICADLRISRLPSAPRLNVSRPREPVEPAATAPPSRPLAVAQSQALRLMRHVLLNTEDVGERFPEEARRIHYGEAEERGIRGKATPDEAAALAEEGIEVVSMALPAALEGPIH